MNIGLMFPFRNPPKWQKPFPQFYDEQLALTQVAEKLNYDTIWLSEHHFAEDGYSPSLMPIAGAIARVTKKIRIGTFLILMPLHDAMQLAEDAAIVDILSNGRLDLGIGQGYSRPEFEGFGVSLTERLSRLREGVDVLRGAWTQKDFSYEGKHYNIKNANLSPRPVQQPHPPLWVGATIPKAAARVARMDCHFLGGISKKAQHVYDETLREAGKDPKNYGSAMLRWCHVAPTREEAWDNAQEHLHYMMDWYHIWSRESFPEGSIPELPKPSEMRNMDMSKLTGAPMIGTPEDILRQIGEMNSYMRVSHLVAGMCLPGMDPAKIKSSMELFAKEVMPKLK